MAERDNIPKGQDPYQIYRNYRDKIPIKITTKKRSPLTCFLVGDKLEPLKIILSPCLVNIFDGDKIPFDKFFEWGQDKTFENYLVPMLSKNFQWGQDPH